jgi:hypothetical protein
MHELAAPANINEVVEFDLWKMAWCTYKNKLEARCHNSVRVYVLIMGQCSQALRNRMEANDEWNNINEGSNVIKVLQLIQNCMSQLMEAEAQVYAFHQCALANNEYYDKFKDLVSNAEWLGSNIGVHSTRAVSTLSNEASLQILTFLLKKREIMQKSRPRTNTLQLCS